MHGLFEEAQPGVTNCLPFGGGHFGPAFGRVGAGMKHGKSDDYRRIFRRFRNPHTSLAGTAGPRRPRRGKDADSGYQGSAWRLFLHGRKPCGRSGQNGLDHHGTVLWSRNLTKIFPRLKG
jgi:hypothetical protein